MTEDDTDFEIPKVLLDQLNEFSGGTYVLIIANQHGQANVYAEADSELLEMGMDKFALEYFRQKDMLHSDRVEKRIKPYDDDDDDDDDDEEGAKVPKA